MDERVFAGFEDPKENWSKLPHSLIEAMPMIETVGEFKVITYILRHTWGYHDDEKRITLDEFANGRKRKDGSRIDNGTGLTIPTVRDGLDRAQQHGFILVEVDDHDKARVKKFYSLNMQGQGEKVLQSGRKTFAIRGKKVCNRSEKDTVEKNQMIETIVPSEISPVPIERKPDILDGYARFALDGDPVRSWTVPAAAGGADDWDLAVDAFAAHAALDPRTLPSKTRREWSRVLQQVGDTWGAGPGVVAEVIRRVPESQLSWKTWSTPHQAAADLGTLVGQHLSGGVKKNGSCKKTNRELLEESAARITGQAGCIETEYEVY